MPETSTVDNLAADQQVSHTAVTCGDSNLTVTVVQPQDTLVQVDHPWIAATGDNPTPGHTCAIGQWTSLCLTLRVPVLNYSQIVS